MQQQVRHERRQERQQQDHVQATAHLQRFMTKNAVPPTMAQAARKTLTTTMRYFLPLPAACFGARAAAGAAVPAAADIEDSTGAAAGRATGTMGVAGAPPPPP